VFEKLVNFANTRFAGATVGTNVDPTASEALAIFTADERILSVMWGVNNDYQDAVCGILNWHVDEVPMRAI
jgi:hypothetical protein